MSWMKEIAIWRFSSTKASFTIEFVIASAAPAPRAWMMRAAIRTSIVGATAQRSDPAV